MKKEIIYRKKSCKLWKLKTENGKLKDERDKRAKEQREVEN
jgi:hypothetical protein